MSISICEVPFLEKFPIYYCFWLESMDQRQIFKSKDYGLIGFDTFFWKIWLIFGCLLPAFVVVFIIIGLIVMSY